MPDPTPTDLPPMERATSIIELTMRNHLPVPTPGGRVFCLHTPTGGGLHEFEGPVYHRLHVAEEVSAALTADGIHLVTEGQAVLGGREVEMEPSGRWHVDPGRCNHYETDSLPSCRYRWSGEWTQLYRPKQHTDSEQG